MSVRLMSAWMVAAALFAAPFIPSSAQNYLVQASNAELTDQTLADIVEAGGTVARTIPQLGIAVVEAENDDFPSRIAGMGGIERISSNPEVSGIVPFFAAEIDVDAAFANPPGSGDDDFFFDTQWGHDSVNSVEAWNAGYRGAGTTVAILDSGIDHDHPDLAPQLDSGRSASFVPGEDWRVTPAQVCAVGVPGRRRSFL